MKKTTKVALRQRKITNGRVSLYLDFYPPIIDPVTKKASRREYLGLYMVEKPKSGSKDEADNERIWNQASKIRNKRENEILKPEMYTDAEIKQQDELEKANMDFLAYFNECAKYKNPGNQKVYESCFQYLERFTNGELKMKDITPKFVKDFKHFLLNSHSMRNNGNIPLSANTASVYFSRFRSVVYSAREDELIRTNFKIMGIKASAKEREILTMEELDQLAAAPCMYPIYKTAALFSALTGLRFGDVQRLTWKSFYRNDDGYHMKLKVQKTGNQLNNPISEQAYKLTGGHSDPSKNPPDERVFDGLKTSGYYARYLDHWLGMAGINKYIRFHNFRHTYATLQLANGTDPYTVSKMMDHSSIKVTEIYLKLVDRMKQETVNRVVLKNL